jgi:hypothetical protein
LNVLRLIIREALGSVNRLRKIMRRFMKGHIPLLIETLKDGVRQGAFDSRVPMPLLLLVVFGIGALPQMIRRASALWPFLSSLPEPEKLATISVQLLSRAVGPIGGNDQTSTRLERTKRRSRET